MSDFSPKCIHDNGEQVCVNRTYIHKCSRSKIDSIGNTQTDTAIIFIMRQVSIFNRLNSVLLSRMIFYNPVVETASRHRAGIRTEGKSDRKSHFYDTHCQMSSLFRVEIFTAAHKNSIKQCLLVGKPSPSKR